MAPPPSSANSDSIPERLGKYQIVTRLSVGGMAELFLAYATGPGGFRKFVALKKILPSFSSDQEFVQMFLDEARIAAGFSHANIAQVFDLGIEDGELYLAIEFVTGKDLRQTMAKAWKQSGLPLGFAARVMRDVCLALYYAHSFTDASGKLSPVIHRDVSPKNVMVGYRGDVKMIDFGIAKARNRLVRTQIGTVKGTPQYMSPEQLHNDTLDGRSDQYAAGAILYEMLANRRLFPERDEPSFLANPTDGHPKPLRRVNPDVPEDVAAVVMRALEPSPSQRFANARDMARALETAAGNRLFDDERIAHTMAELFTEDLATTRAMLEIADASAALESPTAPIHSANRELAQRAGPPEDTRVDPGGTTQLKAAAAKPVSDEEVSITDTAPNPAPVTVQSRVPKAPKPPKEPRRPKAPKAAKPAQAPALPKPGTAPSTVRELFAQSTSSAVVATQTLAILAAESAPGGAALPHHSELEGLVTTTGGTLAWSSAGAVIATFPRPAQALAAAGRIFEGNAARAGIHYANSPVDREGRPMGPPVLTAVRVCELARPGRVFASAPACEVLTYETPRRRVGRLRPVATSAAMGVYELAWRPGQKLKSPIGLRAGMTFAAGVLLAAGAAYVVENWNGGYPRDSKVVPSARPVPPPGASDPLKPAAAPRPRGTLTLVTTPEAEVWIGGRSLGRTPLFNVSLVEGTYVVELVGDDRIHRVLSVPIKASKPAAFRIRLADVPARQ